MKCGAVAFLAVWLSTASCQLEIQYALFYGTSGFNSTAIVPAIEMAERHLNNDSTILANYTLKHAPVRDAMCNRETSLNEFFDMFREPNPKLLALLGCGCSPASEPVAEIAHYRGLSQIAYVSSSIFFDDKQRYPNFFRTFPSDSVFPPLATATIDEFGWRRIVIISQNTAITEGRYRLLEQQLLDRNVTVQHRLLESGRLIRALSDKNFFFDDEDYRVFFINVFVDYAKDIICEGFKRGYFYPKYAWIVYAWYIDGWWSHDVVPGDFNCTSEQLIKTLNNSIAIQVHAVSAQPNATTDAGITEIQFWNEYNKEIIKGNYNSLYVAGLGYDAVWTLAFALDRTSNMVQSMTRDQVLNITGCRGNDTSRGISWSLTKLEDFGNDNELMACVIRWSLQQTNFTGVSGPIEFNRNGSRSHSNSQVFQYRLDANGTLLLTPLALVLADDENIQSLRYLGNESKSTVYTDGVPSDGTQITELHTFNIALVALYYALASLGIIFCLACLIFNFTQRNKKVVRLTSPNVNYLLILGTFLMYLSVFCRLLPSTDPTVNYTRCILDVLVDAVGYYLAFGVVLAKMGRIYYIFHNPTTTKKVIKDWQLIVITLLTAGFGLVLVLLQAGVPQLRPEPRVIPDAERGLGETEGGVRVNNTVFYCTASGSTQSTWLIVIFLYLALLQVIGLILAIQTRKIKVKLLNDSKYIAALTYISSLVLVTRAVAVFTVGHLLNVKEALYSGGVIVLSTAFLTLVFIPKMVSLFRDPSGEKIFNAVEVSVNGRTLSMSVSNDEGKIKQLENTIIQLQRQLTETTGRVILNKGSEEALTL